MRTLVAVMVVALVGCKSQKVIEVETEIAAAKGRVAALDKKRQDLTAEMKRLQVERKTLSQQADEAALAKERLNAAAFALASKPIPDGIQLDEALRSKSPKLGALAAAIVQRQLPCVDPDEEQPSDADGPNDCSPPPLADACEGVAQRSTNFFSWNCQQLPASGKVPAIALCFSSGEIETNDYPLDSPGAHLEAGVIRMAYEKKGRLVVADWPPPSWGVYEPPNWSEQASCSAENDNAQCVRNCDERHGRLGGCGDWGGDGYEGEGEGENEEPYELRAAREAAAREEREAEEARQELSYQECLAGCASPEAEEERIWHVGLDFNRSPAPGLYQFDVEDETEDGGTGGPHTLLLSFPNIHDELGDTAEAPDHDTVFGLATVLDVKKLIEGKVSEGKRIFAGLDTTDHPVGARITMDGTEGPLPLDLDQVCAFGDEIKNALLQERCVVAKKEREEKKEKEAAAAALAAAKKDAGVDAGVDAGIDAGVDGGVDGGAP